MILTPPGLVVLQRTLCIGLRELPTPRYAVSEGFHKSLIVDKINGEADCNQLECSVAHRKKRTINLLWLRFTPSWFLP